MSFPRKIRCCLWSTCWTFSCVFESLDNRKKANLLAVVREYAVLGIQSLITLIDSDMPPSTESDVPVFETDEVVLTLHDEGPDGRLFRMKAW